MHFGAKLRYFKHDTEVESSPKCFFLQEICLKVKYPIVIDRSFTQVKPQRAVHSGINPDPDTGRFHLDFKIYFSRLFVQSLIVCITG